MTRLTEREIGEIRKAQKSAEETRRPGIWQEAGASFANSVIKPLLRLRDRQLTMSALKKLDDRTLSDIGISRGEIDCIADDMAKARHQGQSLWSRWAAALRLRRARRITERELSRLPDAILADIGIERHNIRFVARSLAEQGRSGGTPKAPPESLDTRFEAALRPLRQAVAEKIEQVGEAPRRAA